MRKQFWHFELLVCRQINSKYIMYNGAAVKHKLVNQLRLSTHYFLNNDQLWKIIFEIKHIKSDNINIPRSWISFIQQF